MHLAIIVVLYRKHYSESKSIETLTHELALLDPDINQYTIYIWNNSPEYSPRMQHKKVEWFEGENTPLPKIYNKLADIAFSTDCTAIMISDDDSDYSGFEFNKHLAIISRLSKNKKDALPIGCFIPKIYSNGKLVSPGRRYLFKGSLLKSSPQNGRTHSRNLLAINSSTIITKACYENMKPIYNEHLNFYGTDTDFFVRYERSYKYIYILDASINHSLSENSNETIERALFRWKDHIHAMRITFRSRKLIYNLTLQIYCHALKAKLAIKYKDLRFFKI